MSAPAARRLPEDDEWKDLGAICQIPPEGMDIFRKRVTRVLERPIEQPWRVVPGDVAASLEKIAKRSQALVDVVENAGDVAEAYLDRFIMADPQTQKGKTELAIRHGDTGPHHLEAYRDRAALLSSWATDAAARARSGLAPAGRTRETLTNFVHRLADAVLRAGGAATPGETGTIMKLIEALSPRLPKEFASVPASTIARAIKEAVEAHRERPIYR